LHNEQEISSEKAKSLKNHQARDRNPSYMTIYFAFTPSMDLSLLDESDGWAPSLPFEELA